MIALIDRAHVQHDREQVWLAAKGQKAWATCPLTEIGVLRIAGHRRYPNPPGPPAAMAELLASFRTPPGHAFWQEELSLLDRELVKASRLLNSAHFTDSYLLTLARVHNGQLATLGQRMVTDVIDGPKALHLIR